MSQYSQQLLKRRCASDDLFHTLFMQTAFAFFFAIFSQLRQGHFVAEDILFDLVVDYEQVVDAGPAAVSCEVTLFAAYGLIHACGVYLASSKLVDLTRGELGGSLAVPAKITNESLRY